MKQIIKNVIRDEEVIHFGAAYWNTLRSAAGGLVAKAIFGAILGGPGIAMTSKEHRAGIIAATEIELILVDLEALVGEDFTLEKLRKMTLTGKPTTKRVPLRELDLSTEEEKPEAIVLRISGPISTKATFPNSVEPGNAAKANDISAFASTRR
jgi:hypothetical protein